MLQDFIKQGYRGDDLNRKMQAVQIGIEMGLKQFNYAIEMKDNGYLLFRENDTVSAKEYRIKGNILQVKNDKGEFVVFGNFSANKNIFNLTLLGAEVFALEKY